MKCPTGKKEKICIRKIAADAPTVLIWVMTGSARVSYTRVMNAVTMRMNGDTRRRDAATGSRDANAPCTLGSYLHTTIMGTKTMSTTRVISAS